MKCAALTAVALLGRAVATRAFGFSLLGLVLVACSPELRQAPAEQLAETEACHVKPAASGWREAPVLAAWCEAQPITVVVDRTVADVCPDYEAAFGIWEAYGYPLALDRGSVPAGGPELGRIYLAYAGLPSTDRGRVLLDLEGLAIQSATVLANSCDPCLLARDIGAALGFGKADRPDALMGSQGGCEMSAGELAAMAGSR